MADEYFDQTNEIQISIDITILQDMCKNVLWYLKMSLTYLFGQPCPSRKRNHKQISIMLSLNALLTSTKPFHKTLQYLVLVDIDSI